LKLAGVSKTGKPISAGSGQKFSILRGHLENILLHNKFFFLIVDTCLSSEDITRQSCAMVPRWRFLVTFLRPVFSASRVQHVSDLHPKFAPKPHHVWKYGIGIQSTTAEISRGKKQKKKKEEETTG